jgi:hypothetical protein
MFCRDPNPQLGSKLLQLPYDIRRDIFSYVVLRSIHIIHFEGRLERSDCIATSVEQDGEHEVGYERRLEGSSGSDEEKENVWGRRLESSWGVHWE